MSFLSYTPLVWKDPICLKCWQLVTIYSTSKNLRPEDPQTRTPFRSGVQNPTVELDVHQGNWATDVWSNEYNKWAVATQCGCCQLLAGHPVEGGPLRGRTPGTSDVSLPIPTEISRGSDLQTGGEQGPNISTNARFIATWQSSARGVLSTLSLGGHRSSEGVHTPVERWHNAGRRCANARPACPEGCVDCGRWYVTGSLPGPRMAPAPGAVAWQRRTAQCLTSEIRSVSPGLI